MVRYFKSLVVALLLSVCVCSVGKAASFDCNKATTETEIAICGDPELSALDELISLAWERVDSNTFINEQRSFLKDRNACEERTCLLQLMGTRVGQLLATSEGFQQRVAETPFRVIPSKTVFVRCRRNYQGTDTLKYAELLFSHEENGATFQETNIVMNGDHSESLWSWLIWSASASTDQINTSAYSQNILRRSYSVSQQYISSLRHGSMFQWIIYEDVEQGAAFLTFNFDTTTDIKDCIEILDGHLP